VTANSDSRPYSTPLLFTLIFLGLFALHAPLLRLPYFWDEAGYYIPAARDLLLSGSLIPYSSPSNAHPPLVMAYLALAWKILGFTPVVTRTAMLLVAAFALLGVFRLAQRVANTEVAIASAICTALYPVFFTQSSLAHLDLAAAAFTFWGLLAYVDDRRPAIAFWFSLAVLTKETAILAPLALFAWELLGTRILGLAAKRRQNEAHGASRGSDPQDDQAPEGRKKYAALLFPCIPLALWYAYHYHRTGFLFGNPEFFRYNVQATLHPLRILLALGLRLWQLLAYLNLYLLTLATVLAMFRKPLFDRQRIAIPVQFAFLCVILAYAVAMAIVGGAVLARYMLPVVPLVIIVFVSTLRRRVRVWRGVTSLVALAFIVALFFNPPYGISLEDNLAYRDYIQLHQRAETFLEAHYPMSRVLTAWPASDELASPYLGYVARPMRVLRIEDFTAEQLFSASDLGSKFDVALIFSTKYEPSHPLFERWESWQRWKTEFFGYHRDVSPAAAARILGGQLVYEDHRPGQWVAVIEMVEIKEARALNAKMPGILANPGQSSGLTRQR
jgi:dolichyl-phosphate-mannose-protein mannosyltransferase